MNRDRLENYKINILHETVDQFSFCQPRYHTQEYFEDLVKFMTSGPSHILVLTKGETGEGIIEEWRDLLGPTAVEDAKEVAPDR